MPRRKGNQLKASRQQRNAGGQFSNNREIFEVGDDVSETEVDEIDDLDCRERGWHSEQDDNGSESDDPSCDEFDECEIEPHLPQDEKRTILIAHDESIFYSNECSRIVWLQHGQRLMRPKSS
jgi:hypothetical protein